MCRTIVLLTVLEVKDVEELMKERMITGYVEYDYLDATGPSGKRTMIISAGINGIDDKCLCNITDEEKLKVFKFIYDISIM